MTAQTKRKQDANNGIGKRQGPLCEEDMSKKLQEFFNSIKIVARDYADRAKTTNTVLTPIQAADVFANAMNLDPRFELAASATFSRHGLKIVVTRISGNERDEINLAEERQQAFEDYYEPAEAA